MTAPASFRQHDEPDYQEFYGLVESPFTPDPDPRFLYLGPSHDEALTFLRQSIGRKDGFVVLTGDAGTGKTTLCRALVERLDATTVASLVPSPSLTIEELVREMLLGFGLISPEGLRHGSVAPASRQELVSSLHHFLRSLVPIKGSGVLIIDEAQHLSSQLLDQIHAIAMPEGSDARLLQVVLSGEPALLDRLAQEDVRELNQRIPIRATVKPLGREEVDGYVAHRLSVAGGSGAPAFAPAALDGVHRQSGGVPRVVNLLCDRALTLGAQLGITVITPEVVEEAAHDVGVMPITVPEPAGWWTRIPFWLRVAGPILVLLALIAAWLSGAP